MPRDDLSIRESTRLLLANTKLVLALAHSSVIKLSSSHATPKARLHLRLRLSSISVHALQLRIIRSPAHTARDFNSPTHFINEPMIRTSGETLFRT